MRRAWARATREISTWPGLDAVAVPPSVARAGRRLGMIRMPLSHGVTGTGTQCDCRSVNAPAVRVAVSECECRHLPAVGASGCRPIVARSPGPHLGSLTWPAGCQCRGTSIRRRLEHAGASVGPSPRASDAGPASSPAGTMTGSGGGHSGGPRARLAPPGDSEARPLARGPAARPSGFCLDHRALPFTPPPWQWDAVT
jgi:hypothetical protein